MSSRRIVPSLRDFIASKFPKLSIDKNFKMVSDFDLKYNCIAYACGKNDRFYWPDSTKDGIEWPFGLPLNESIGTFISLFEHYKYQVCDDHMYEENYQKVALYELNGTCSHASLQRFNGLWKSKMGYLEDIEHSDPFTIEGPGYGLVKVFMKRANDGFKLKEVKFPQKIAR